MLIGSDAIERLKSSRVAVFGLGGVGGHVVEALARSGIGTLDIVDGDVVDESNINRQIIATTETVGMAKVDAFEERIRLINPDAVVNKHHLFYLPSKDSSCDSNRETASTEGSDFDFTCYDYVVDAIDTVAAKLDIIEKCTVSGTPIISAMGCGNRLDPTKLVVTDINKTEMDPLAKVMRKELRNRGIKRLKVVYSTEQPIKYDEEDEKIKQILSEESAKKRHIPGSTAFVPGAAGLIIASEVVRDLITPS